MQGDQRQKSMDFFLKEGIATKETVKCVTFGCDRNSGIDRLLSRAGCTVSERTLLSLASSPSRVRHLVPCCLLHSALWQLWPRCSLLPDAQAAHASARSVRKIRVFRQKERAGLSYILFSSLPFFLSLHTCIPCKYQFRLNFRPSVSNGREYRYYSGYRR